MDMFTKLAVASEKAERHGKRIRTWYLTEDEVEQLIKELYNFDCPHPVKNYYDMYLAILDDKTTIFGGRVKIHKIAKKELKREAL